jgi:hypothetical protein
MHSCAVGEADELYEMANLYPAETGLPVTVWVSPRGRCGAFACFAFISRPASR